MEIPQATLQRFQIGNSLLSKAVSRINPCYVNVADELLSYFVISLL
jgi:hypothetical protein